MKMNMCQFCQFRGQDYKSLKKEHDALVCAVNRMGKLSKFLLEADNVSCEFYMSEKDFAAFGKGPLGHLKIRRIGCGF